MSNIISLSDRKKKKAQSNKSGPINKLIDDLTYELEVRDSRLITALDAAHARIEELEKRQDATFKLLRKLVEDLKLKL
jgi:hypothetical protein